MLIPSLHLFILLLLLVKAKVIIVSTPHGMNHFYRLWHDDERKNEYIPTDVHWSEVPGRDLVWKEQTIDLVTSEQQFKIEFECEFLGSVDTLIAPSKLKALVYEDPIQRNARVDVYEEPQKDHDYAVTVDVASWCRRRLLCFCGCRYPYIPTQDGGLIGII